MGVRRNEVRCDLVNYVRILRSAKYLRCKLNYSLAAVADLSPQERVAFSDLLTDKA